MKTCCWTLALIGCLALTVGAGCKNEEDKEDQAATGGGGGAAAGGGGAAEKGGGPGGSRSADRQLGAKLGAYIHCINYVSKRVFDARRRYLSWIKDPKAGPTCKERHVHGTYTISGVSSCVKKITAAKGQPPKLPKLEAAADKFARGIKTLEPLLKKADRYYDQKDYKDDGCKKAQEMHPKLMAAWALADAGDKGMRAGVDHHNRELQARLLARYAKKYGKKHPRYLHKLVMQEARDLLHFLRGQEKAKKSERDNAGIKAKVLAFNATVEKLEKSVDAHKKEISRAFMFSSFRSSVVSYLKAAKEFMRRKRSGKKYSRMERRWLKGSSAWMVSGSYGKLLRKYNDMVNSSNRVRYRFR